jgi:hypothetical protein
MIVARTVIRCDHGSGRLDSSLCLARSSSNVCARHHDPLHVHVALYAFRTVYHELFDIGLFEMLAKCLRVSPDLIRERNDQAT